MPFSEEMPGTSVNSPGLRAPRSVAPEPRTRLGTASAAAGYIEATVVDCAATGFLSLTPDETKVSTRMEQVFSSPQFHLLERGSTSFGTIRRPWLEASPEH